MNFRRIFRLVVIITVSTLLIGEQRVLPGDQYERVRAFTRTIEFDFLRWTLNALGIKLGQAALGAGRLPWPAQQRPRSCWSIWTWCAEIKRKEAELADMYANPDIADPLAASVDLRDELDSCTPAEHRCSRWQRRSCRARLPDRG